MTDYFAWHGTYEQRKAQLREASRAWLESTLLDHAYNKFLSSYADYQEEEPDLHGHGKRVPYIGWYWRHVTFSDLTSIPIGDCGYFVGFMVNNKWNHPERTLTETEAREVLAIIDEAMRLNSESGVRQRVTAKLDELWDFMQTLRVT